MCFVVMSRGRMRTRERGRPWWGVGIPLEGPGVSNSATA